MNKGGNFSMEAMGPSAKNGELHDGSPMAEAKGNQDEIDLAIFGKRPQLKVRSPSLTFHR